MTFDEAFSRLGRSKFRSRFKLAAADRAYIAEKGLDTIRHHTEDFVRQKLASAHPVNDGKQTPMRGHPVFKAQHATATCCRGCMEKWECAEERSSKGRCRRHGEAARKRPRRCRKVSISRQIGNRRLST